MPPTTTFDPEVTMSTNTMSTNTMSTNAMSTNAMSNNGTLASSESIPTHAHVEPGLPTPKERNKMQKAKQRAERAVRKAKAVVQTRKIRLDMRKVALHDAKGSLDVARELASGKGKDMSTLQFVLIFVVVSAFQWNVDRGSLLVLRLPLGVTGILAASLVAISALAAHMAGKIWGRKRDLGAEGIDLQRGEYLLLVSSMVGGLGLAVAIAAIRAMYAGMLSGVLFLIAGVLLFLLMTFASYLHANGAVERVERAYRTVQRRQNAVVRAEARWEKAKVAHAAATAALVGECRNIAAKIDMSRKAYKRSHPDYEPPDPELSWVTDLRTMAGGTIPQDLQP